MSWGWRRAKSWGLKKGLEKGVESIIKKMHKNGAGADAISSMTGIELAKIESILSK